MRLLQEYLYATLEKAVVSPYLKVIVGIVTLLLLTLVACNTSKPIPVGFAGELTGPRADLGVAGRNGAQLAVEIINGNRAYTETMWQATQAEFSRLGGEIGPVFTFTSGETDLYTMTKTPILPLFLSSLPEHLIIIVLLKSIFKQRRQLSNISPPLT